MALPPSRIDPRRAALGDEVYATISAAILDGTLPPGERLRDHELAEQFGVSRTPVREALMRLARSGLVEMAPNRYTRVSTPTDSLVSDTVEFLVYTVGSCLLIFAGRADEEAMDETLALLDAVIETSRADDAEGMLRTSATFFEGVVTAIDNIAFLTVLREAETAIRRNLADWRPHIASPVTRTAAYERLREAIAVRDGRQSEILMRELHGFS